MRDPDITPREPPANGRWTPERVYASYRLFLAASILPIYHYNTGSGLGATYPALFEKAAIGYLIVTFLSIIIQTLFRRTSRTWSPLVSSVVDIFFLTTFIHASGGLGNNLGVLMMVAIAAANILLPGRIGLFVAALASLSLLFEQLWFGLQQSRQNPFQLTEPALLGVAFFVVAIITRQIVDRLASSEALSARQAKALLQLEALNRQIVRRMRTGILVIDNNFRILLANPSAEALVPHDGNELTGAPLPERVRELYYSWWINPTMQRPSVQFSPTGPTVLIRFATLDADAGELTIIFLEDHRQLAHEAQQMKLNSLGRMSATIAHEIRNPLSAINHAAGLLSDNNDPGNKRLIEIIMSHVLRVNNIIDDVLNLSRRPANAAQRLRLADAISRLETDLENSGVSTGGIVVRPEDDAVEVRFDPDQLNQVLINLVSNAFRHGGSGVTVTISYGIDPRTELPWMQISDDGAGIDKEAEAHLFEPFHTTSKQGTGLGLFVCRELCEGNQARLDYEACNNGAHFIITFAHPDRVFQ